MVKIFYTTRHNINRAYLEQTTVSLLEKAGVPPEYGVNIIFVGKRKMKEIALKYKNEDVALPVLTFTYKEDHENENLLGEIFICYPQAVLLAAEKEKTVDHMLSDLIDHGINNLLKS